MSCTYALPTTPQDWPKKPSKTDLQHALTLAGGGKFGLQPGGVTDPSELMILLARACITATPSSVAQVVETAAEYYVSWVKARPPSALSRSLARLLVVLIELLATRRGHWTPRASVHGSAS